MREELDVDQVKALAAGTPPRRRSRRTWSVHSSMLAFATHNSVHVLVDVR